MLDQNAAANKVKPDLIDVFIILLLATALNIFLFTVATQFIHDPVFQSLPSFLTDTYSAIWTSLATGAAGIGLHPNYLVYVLLTAGAFLLAIFMISFLAYRLAPVSILSVPPDVALITGRNMAQRQFEFSALPGSPQMYHLKGNYAVQEGKVSGELKSGVFKTAENFAPLFATSITGLLFQVCFLHSIRGADQMDVFPIVPKSDYAIDLNIPLVKGNTYDLPPMTFVFDLPQNAEPNRTWLCAGITNTFGYYPAR